jgi:PAS domain-containing protein
MEVNQQKSYALTQQCVRGCTKAVRSNQSTIVYILADKVLTAKMTTDLPTPTAGSTPGLKVFTDALATLPLGVAMFDASANLVFANLAYYSLLDLTPTSTPIGTNLHAIFQALRRRGEFIGGPLSDVVEQQMQVVAAGQPHAFERARPNGRWISVTHAPMPDGYFIRTHQDITERVERQWQQEGVILDLKTRGLQLEQEIARLQAR